MLTWRVGNSPLSELLVEVDTVVARLCALLQCFRKCITSGGGGTPPVLLTFTYAVWSLAGYDSPHWISTQRESIARLSRNGGRLSTSPATCLQTPTQTRTIPRFAVVVPFVSGEGACAGTGHSAVIYLVCPCIMSDTAVQGSLPVGCRVSSSSPFPQFLTGASMPTAGWVGRHAHVCVGGWGKGCAQWGRPHNR